MRCPVTLALVLLTCCATATTQTEAADRDGDGIANAADRCPDAAEDRDGFEDADGCPDPDNDSDDLLDVCDKCPDEPETWNGIDDDDGCPDAAPVSLQVDLRVAPRVLFVEGSARVEAPALALVDDVAKLLLATPKVELLRVRGSACAGEPDPVGLSQRRARAVRELLVQHGVAPERLEVSGDGLTRPLSADPSERGRALERRVDFEIVRATAEVIDAGVVARARPATPGCPEVSPARAR